MPAMTILNPLPDEESDVDESLSLDLHVSDSEDVDDIAEKRVKLSEKIDDLPKEIEDEILNKYDICESENGVDDIKLELETSTEKSPKLNGSTEINHDESIKNVESEEKLCNGKLDETESDVKKYDTESIPTKDVILKEKVTLKENGEDLKKNNETKVEGDKEVEKLETTTEIHEESKKNEEKTDLNGVETKQGDSKTIKLETVKDEVEDKEDTKDDKILKNEEDLKKDDVIKEEKVEDADMKSIKENEMESELVETNLIESNMDGDATVKNIPISVKESADNDKIILESENDSENKKEEGISIAACESGGTNLVEESSKVADECNDEKVLSEKDCEVDKEAENKDAEDSTVEPISEDKLLKKSEAAIEPTKDGEDIVKINNILQCDEDLLNSDDCDAGEDLLQVMEEKEADADEKEFIDIITQENSCSSYDKDENGKDEEEESLKEQNEESVQDDIDQPDEACGSDDLANDDTDDIDMDIDLECSGIDKDTLQDMSKDKEDDIDIEEQVTNLDDMADAIKIIESISTDKTETEQLNKSSTDLDVCADSLDTNKVIETKSKESVNDTNASKDINVELDKKTDDETTQAVSVLKRILTSDTIAHTTSTITQASESFKSSKRSLSDSSTTEEDTIKKIKLSDEENRNKNYKDLKKLGTFKDVMLDKTLKGLTRDQLEDFCVQKMCESIVQRSEIGELKIKVKFFEQLLDCLRKDAAVLSKQSRDLNIVHTKVLSDLKKFGENPDKPLVVPKITRSVGLQAIVREEPPKRIQVNPPAKVAIPKTRVIPAKPATPRPSPMKIQRTTQPIAPRPSPIKTNTPVKKPMPVKRQIVNPTNKYPQAAKKMDKGSYVVDLTDEDEKKPTSGTAVAVSKLNTTGTKINMINTANAGSQNSPAGKNVMLAQPIRSVQNANGVIRTIPSQVVRTVGASPTYVRNRLPSPNTTPVPPLRTVTYSKTSPALSLPASRHPAPLPPPPTTKSDIFSRKPFPPKPQLTINKTSCGTGIVLSWKMPYKLDNFEDIASYQLYAYQETKTEPRTENWGKIGDVKALDLPMAVTLTQFAVGNRYFFAVRAVDVLTRHGLFSEYQTILL